MTFGDVLLVGTKYRIKTFDLTIGSTYKYSVSNKLIMSMTIVEDYDKFIFPYFEMVFAVPTNTYRLLQKHAEDIKATMNLQKAKFKDAVTLEVDTSNAFRNCLNQTFYVMFTDTTPELTEAEQKIVEQSENAYGTLSTVKVLLYPYEYYKKFDNVANDVLRNATLADALTYCINKAGISNVLFSPPTNCKRYNQFIITPIPFKNQVERICNSYAMHTYGTLIFFGLDRMYIIDKEPKCTAYETNEFTITYIVADGKSPSTSQTGGCYEHQTKKYNLVNATNIDIKDKQQTALKTAGSNIIAVDSSGTVTKSDTSGSGTTKVIVQEEGDNTLSAVNRGIIETKFILTANFANIDIQMLTPNKQFILTLDGTSEKATYNGRYRITRVSHVFAKDGDNFVVNTTAEFKG